MFTNQYQTNTRDHQSMRGPCSMHNGNKSKLWKRSSIFVYMLLLGMLLWKVGMNLTHDWTSTHETMQCPISVSQKAYSGWESVRKKCTAFDIRQRMGDTLLLGYKASLQVGKHTHHERKHWCHWQLIMVLLIPGLDWALCRLYASFL